MLALPPSIPFSVFTMARESAKKTDCNQDTLLRRTLLVSVSDKCGSGLRQTIDHCGKVTNHPPCGGN